MTNYDLQHNIKKKFKKMMIVLTCMLKLEAACFTRIRVHVRDFLKMFKKHPANNKGNI